MSRRWRPTVALAPCMLLLALALPAPLRAADADAKADSAFDALDLGGSEELTLPEDSGGQESPEIDLGTAVVLGARSLAAVLGDSHALTVLSAEEFAAARSVGEALERVPGLDVRFQGGQGQLATAQLRGARANQVLVLIDGQPVAPGAAADLSGIPLQVVERVEVLRGPEAARFGAGALGGVVNFITRQVQSGAGQEDAESPFPLDEHKAELAREHNARTSLAELELLGGSNSSGGVGLSWQDEQVCWRIAHNQARNDYGFSRAGAGRARRQNNDARQDQFWAAWRAGGVQQRLAISALDRGVPGSAEFPTLAARLVQQQLLWQGSGGDWRVGFSATHTRYSDPTPYLHTGAIDSRSTRLRLEAAWGAAAAQAGPWGVRPYLDYIDSSDYGAKQRFGVELNRHFSLGGASGPWSIDAGITAATDQGLAPLARLGWSRALNKTWTAYAAGGYAVRFPDFEELYLRQSGAVQGDPELKPERALSGELGLKAALPQASLQATAFTTSYRDAIIFVPVSSYLVKAANTGAARVTGLEALLDWQLGRGLWWRTAYTWLPTAEYSSGVPLTGRAKQHANSRLEWAGAGWRCALSADYTGAMPADLLGNLLLKPRTLYGVELGREWGGGGLSLELSNLFNKGARDSWNYPLPGREINIKWKVKL
jgi:vitamin B12 transporter